MTKRTKHSGKRLAPVNGHTRNSKATMAHGIGELLKQQVYALGVECSGCGKHVIASVPAEVAKQFTQGTEIPIACEGCGQRVMVGKSLVLHG